MELEEMKQRWDELSRRLDKQQIITRSLLESTIRQRRLRIANFTRFNLFTTAAAFPICIGIALWRGLIGLKFLWAGMAGMGIVLLFEIGKMRLINRMERCETDITKQEHLVNRYRRTQLYAYFFSNIFVALYIGWILFSKWEQFGSSRAGLLIGIILGAILLGVWFFRQEADAIRELRRADQDLREFIRE